jgi:hypothetical protein
MKRSRHVTIRSDFFPQFIDAFFDYVLLAPFDANLTDGHME